MVSFKLICILCLFCITTLAQYSLTSGVYGHFIQDLSSTTLKNFNTEASTWKVFNAINSSNPSSTYNSTNSSALVYVCNTYILRGGDGILQSGGYFQKTYTGLPVHDIIYFSFYFDILGTTNYWGVNDYFNITFDNETIGSDWRFASSSYYDSYVCGSNYETIIGLRPVGKVFHIANSLTITITSNVISSGASFGFRQVALNLANRTTSDVENSCYTGSNYDLYVSAAGCQVPTGWASYTWAGCSGVCDHCFGSGTTTECYNCAANYGFNGQSCVSCYSGCSSCLDSSVNSCTKCQSGYYHYWNNTCIYGCDSSLYYQEFTLENDCKPLCHLNNTFTYWDDSCNSVCEFPLVQATINGVKSCLFPCAAGYYLYSDGTCSATCAYTAWVYLGQNMCKMGCIDPQQYYYPSDNTCRTSCPKPLTAYSSSFTGLTCISNCSSTSDYLYDDGSCLSTCPAYRLVTSLARISFCQNACISGYYFHTYDSGCRTTCSSPLQPMTTTSNYTCVYPCLRTQILNTNGLCSGTCAAPFYLTLRPEGFNICNSPCSNSDYYYQESNTCKSTCPYPYTVASQQGANFCTLIITPEERDQAAQANAITDGGGTTASAGAVVASILSSGDPASLGAGSLVKLMQYMKFLDIGYPPKLYVMLREQKIARAGITFSPAINSVVASKFPSQPLPQKFEDAGVPSSFFINMWELTITLAITVASVLAIIILEKITRNYRTLHQTAQKVKVALKWNLLLTIFCSNFGDISLYSALELSTLSFDSFFSVLSFIQCLMFNAFILFVVFRAFQISRKLHRIRKASPPLAHNRKIGSLYKKWESYQMLFQGFHNISVLQQMFTLNLVIRAYIINMVVGLLYAYPLVQAIFLTASSCCMIIYLLIKMPMLSRLNNIQQIVFEIIVLIVNICILALSIMDNNGTVDASLRVTIGDIVLGTNVAMGIISPTFLALKLCVIVYDVYMTRKASKTAQRASTKTISNQKKMLSGPMNTVQKLPRARLKMPFRQTRQITTDMRPLDLSSNTLSQNTSYQMSQGTQSNTTNFS